MPSFQEWMYLVDQCVYGIVGCSIYDLPDCPFMDWYKMEYPPEDAASEALEYAGW